MRESRDQQASPGCLALTPATIVGAWFGKRVIHRLSDPLSIRFVERGLLLAVVLFLTGA